MDPFPPQNTACYLLVPLYHPQNETKIKNPVSRATVKGGLGSVPPKTKYFAKMKFRRNEMAK
jgi:hypothetical protein